MRFLDLIEHKKRGEEIDGPDWHAAVQAYVQGRVPDYQMAALLMAVRWRGLSDAETSSLLDAMIASGERWNFDHLGGPVVDKHSTGGVGDKVSLVLAPLAAACGCIVPMISGRGLGHSGGTLDKLECIPGLRTRLERPEFERQLSDIGVAMGAQTERLVPADRLLYALRDATATVDEPGLITASILSKKIAEGARGLVLDVKTGGGAFLQGREATTALADRLCRVGATAGMRCVAWLTDMNAPLGRAVGNAPEVLEALACLRGGGPEDLRELVLTLTAEMLSVAGLHDAASARERAAAALDSGEALARFARLVEAQGGDPRIAENDALLPRAPRTLDLLPHEGAWIAGLDARAIGNAAVTLGAGRDTKEANVDPAAGLVLHAVVGDRVAIGTPWATLHYRDGAAVELAARLMRSAVRLGDSPPAPQPLLIERRA